MIVLQITVLHHRSQQQSGPQTNGLLMVGLLGPFVHRGARAAQQGKISLTIYIGGSQAS